MTVRVEPSESGIWTLESGVHIRREVTSEHGCCEEEGDCQAGGDQHDREGDDASIGNNEARTGQEDGAQEDGFQENGGQETSRHTTSGREDRGQEISRQEASGQNDCSGQGIRLEIVTLHPASVVEAGSCRPRDDILPSLQAEGIDQDRYGDDRFEGRLLGHH